VKIKINKNPYDILSTALENAIYAGMNKTDKYCEEQLTKSQRSLLLNHIDNYFFLNLEEEGVIFE
jgi:hypothetical protein